MELQILGPVDSLVPAGQTVQFLCRAVTTARTLLTLQVCSLSSCTSTSTFYILHSASLRVSGCGSTRSCRRAAPGTTGTGGWRSAAWRWVAARQGRCTAHAQVADTGVYICVARLGDAVTTARANLTVTTGPPVGINQPDPRSVARA